MLTPRVCVTSNLKHLGSWQRPALGDDFPLIRARINVLKQNKNISCNTTHYLHLPGGTIKPETHGALSIAVVPKLERAPDVPQGPHSQTAGPQPQAASSGLGWSLGNRTPDKLPGAAGPATTSQGRLVSSQAKEQNKNRIVQHGIWVSPPPVPRCLASCRCRCSLAMPGIPWLVNASLRSPFPSSKGVLLSASECSCGLLITTLVSGFRDYPTPG